MPTPFDAYLAKIAADFKGVGASPTTAITYDRRN
jgi:hypothetical protein